jgi:uncharacterized protein YjeT (DUF2065 family)
LYDDVDASRSPTRAHEAPERRNGRHEATSAGLADALAEVTHIAATWNESLWKRRWEEANSPGGGRFRFAPALLLKRIRYSHRAPYRQLRSLGVNAVISGIVVVAVLVALHYA